MKVSEINRQAVAESTDMVSAYDPRLNVSIWNAACEKHYGITAGEAIGAPLLSLFPHIKNDHRVQCLIDAATTGQTFFFQGLPYTFQSGYYTQLILSLEFSEGEILGAISIVRDHSIHGIYSQKELLKPLLRERYVELVK